MGRGRSSISCSADQRKKISKIKMNLEELFGYEPTDRDFIDLLLETYEKKYPYRLSEWLENIVKELSNIVAGLREFELLRQENEELRKEIEELKEKLKDGLTSATYEELHDRFVRTLSRHLEQMGMKGVKFNDDVYEGLMVLLNMFKTPTGAVKGLELLGRAVRAFNVNYDSV
ncbi:hypothetical protein [Archaeoglobus profundus]|uniref:Uncharacterized protein n=1 Tax=Archaeoglobus profundus (strain DSM 5631 / JCM 9629 / NBRC 100127 / Av18) TaxID=572546 RepID=D2RHW9_ARCPA|nr:hypothetical protein [Archaeoglobus profundus]ADB57894.1 hypothetical protein Arcpr_0831 [Archaeoglobus profundus DSM 5631]